MSVDFRIELFLEFGPEDSITYLLDLSLLVSMGTGRVPVVFGSFDIPSQVGDDESASCCHGSVDFRLDVKDSHAGIEDAIDDGIKEGGQELGELFITIKDKCLGEVPDAGKHIEDDEDDLAGFHGSVFIGYHMMRTKQSSSGLE